MFIEIRLPIGVSLNSIPCRMVKPRIVLLIFVSGKVVLTGAKVTISFGKEFVVAFECILFLHINAYNWLPHYVGANRNLRGVREYLPNSEEFQEAVKLFFAYESKPSMNCSIGYKPLFSILAQSGNCMMYGQKEIQLVEKCLLFLYYPISPRTKKHNKCEMRPFILFSSSSDVSKLNGGKRLKQK